MLVTLCVEFPSCRKFKRPLSVVVYHYTVPYYRKLTMHVNNVKKIYVTKVTRIFQNFFANTNVSTYRSKGNKTSSLESSRKTF